MQTDKLDVQEIFNQNLAQLRQQSKKITYFRNFSAGFLS